jgi:hypothetical protein
MVSTASVRPTKGKVRNSVVRDWAIMDVIRVWRSDCFLHIRLVCDTSAKLCIDLQGRIAMSGHGRVCILGLGGLYRSSEEPLKKVGLQLLVLLAHQRS